ncbi:MAG: hypothetical protein IE918_08125 [Campylobacterales bacterium]|nr:hypothetical protein [Campylobacterales bacterium]
MKFKLLMISLLLTGTLFAEFKVGEKLPPISLPDQFENTLQVESTDRLLIMAFEKDISSAINDYLKAKPAGYLNEHHAKYISDISAMPSLITSMFAIPKMKKFPFSIMLIYNDLGKEFSKEKGRITVYRIKNHQIDAIEFVAPNRLPALFR